MEPQQREGRQTMDTLTTLIYAVAVLVTLDVAAVTLGRSPDARAPRRTRRKA